MEIPRIARRLPFGFRGEWGKLFKRWTTNEAVNFPDERVLKYEKNWYVAIEQAVQFKRGTDVQGTVEQPLTGLAIATNYCTVQTTDATWNTKTKRYESIANQDDIVFYRGAYWIVTNQAEEVLNELAQTYIYSLDLMSVGI